MGSKKPDIWRPIIDFQKSLDVQPTLELPDGSCYIRSYYSKYGVINWYQRYKGNICLQHDLREFPFDRQIFSIKLGCTLWAADYILLRNITPPDLVALFPRGMNLTEWELVSDTRIKETVELQLEDKREISHLEIACNLRRKSSYYLSHVVFLVLLINIMSWTGYILAEDIATRLSLDITLFLALVALNFVVTSFIPKVSYSTKLSTYFVVGYALLTFSTLHNVGSYYLYNYHCNSKGDPHFPPTIVNGTIMDDPIRCWTGLYYDWSIVFIIAVGTIIYTLVFIISGSKSKPGEVVHELHPQQKPLLSIYDDPPIDDQYHLLKQD